MPDLPPSDDRRLVYHEPLKPWSPLTREEYREADRFIRRLVRFPVVTATLVTLVVAGYLTQIWAGWPLAILLPTPGVLSEEIATQIVGDRMGWLHAPSLWAGEYWRLLSPTLLHGSLLHLAGNSVVLFFLGRIVENLYGRAAMITAYVGAGASGALLSAATSPGVESLGASGAILGLLGVSVAFGLRYRSRIPHELRHAFGLDMWAFVVLVAGMSLLPFVDWAGHLGGFLFGLVVGALWPAEVYGHPHPAVRGVGLALGGFAAFCLAATVGTVVTRTWTSTLPEVQRDLRALGRAVNADQPDEAERLSDQLLERFPEGVDGLDLQRLQILAVAGRFDDALQVASGMDLEGKPSMRELRFGVAMVAERWDIAVEDMRALEAGQPSLARDPSWQNNAAWALFNGFGDDAAARRDGLRRVREALAEAPDEHAYRNTLAYGLLLDGQDVLAEGVLHEMMATSEADQHGDDVFMHVAALARLGRADEARREYQRYAPRFPGGFYRAEAAELLGLSDEP